MKVIELSGTVGLTAVLKVSYKGDIWERRENSKVINWFVFDSNSNKRFIYQCILYTNNWRQYINDSTVPKDIETPYVEKSYKKLINPLKLYKFELECFYTTLYGVFVATEKDIQSAMGKTLSFGQVDEDREVSELFGWSMLEELKVNQTTIEDLFKVNEQKTISGYNPLNYIKD